jgi:Rrf2 family cysteine metabolism transcriptional repressor
MKVSTKGRYGLQIMMELALHHGAGPVLVSAIAQNQALPGKYIHVLVGGLKAAGLVRAVRGPNGGLELARDPSRITPLDVVTALEGRLVEEAPEGASGETGESSVAREVWSQLALAMEASLARHTLAELAERQRSRGVLGYSI